MRGEDGRVGRGGVVGVYIIRVLGATRRELELLFLRYRLSDVEGSNESETRICVVAYSTHGTAAARCSDGATEW